MSTRASSILTGLLAAALIALAMFAVISAANLNSDVGELEARASDMQKQMEVLQESSSGNGNSSLKEVARRLKKIEECLPEIQTEINSLDLEAIGGEYFISTSSQVSSYCSSIVYPPVGD